MANLIVETNQNAGSDCYKLLEKVESDAGLSIWSGPDKINLQGAFYDLVPGSQALQQIESAGIIKTWNSVVGITQLGFQPFLFAHDSNLNKLWQGLWLYCDKVPDPSFFGWFGNKQSVFLGENDRIVSKESQGYFADSQFIKIDVDHSTVLNSQEVVNAVKEEIDR